MATSQNKHALQLLSYWLNMQYSCFMKCFITGCKGPKSEGAGDEPETSCAIHTHAHAHAQASL